MFPAKIGSADFSQMRSIREARPHSANVRQIGVRGCPKRNDSVQNTLDQAVKAVTGKDGMPARAVRETVADAIITSNRMIE